MGMAKKQTGLPLGSTSESMVPQIKTKGKGVYYNLDTKNFYFYDGTHLRNQEGKKVSVDYNSAHNLFYLRKKDVQEEINLSKKKKNWLEKCLEKGY